MKSLVTDALVPRTSQCYMIHPARRPSRSLTCGVPDSLQQLSIRPDADIMYQAVTTKDENIEVQLNPRHTIIPSNSSARLWKK